jgi:hypothetical protein
MATVQGLTKDRMLAIEAASVVSGLVDGSGHLILETHGGSTIDAGDVIGPPGADGATLIIDTKLGTDVPSTYPTGTSLFSVSTDATWPLNDATVLTHKIGTTRAFQTITKRTTGETHIRAQTSLDAWGSWVVFATSSDISSLDGRLDIIEAHSGLNRPAFQAVSSVDQTKSGTASSVKINFATEELDLGSDYDSATSRFTAPLDGLYEITGVFASTTTTSGPEIELFKNGTILYNNVAIGYTTAYSSFGFTVLVDLVANDYVELYLTNNNGVTTTLSGGRCRFSGKYIG